LSAYFITGQDLDWYYVGFVICSTYILYNAHRIIGLTRIPTELRKNRHLIFKKDSAALLIFVFITIGIGLYCFIHLKRQLIFLLLFPTLISAFYVFPIFNKRRARDISYIKIFFIAFAWSFLFIIPLVHLSLEDIGLILFEKFLFFLGITIPFDNRDRDIDLQSGLKTWANITTPENALKWSSTLILFAMVICGVLVYTENYTLYEGVALVGTYCLAHFLVQNSLDQDEFYFLFYLDGLIALNGIALIFSSIFI